MQHTGRARGQEERKKQSSNYRNSSPNLGNLFIYMTNLIFWLETELCPLIQAKPRGCDLLMGWELLAEQEGSTSGTIVDWLLSKERLHPCLGKPLLVVWDVTCFCTVLNPFPSGSGSRTKAGLGRGRNDGSSQVEHSAIAGETGVLKLFRLEGTSGCHLVQLPPSSRQG